MRRLWVVEVNVGIKWVYVEASPSERYAKAVADMRASWQPDEQQRVTAYHPHPTPERMEEIASECMDIWDTSDCTSPAEPVEEMIEAAIRHALNLASNPEGETP